MHSFSSDLPETKPVLNPSHPSYNVGESVATYPPLHLVYVHGFRGDHTSFQRFPTDLHIRLDERVPSLETHVFPTYKSRKPLHVAVERLMTWIDTLEAGFVILIGHSLGGFVVAEAALQYVNRRSQVIGLVAMDVPYVGVHPHVIVSGIVSLFPSSKKHGLEQDLNDMDKVHMVSQSAVDGTNSPRTTSPSTSPPRAISPAPTSGRLSVSSTFSNSSGRSNLALPDLTPGPTAWQNTVHFFKKHSEDPLAAMTQWVVSHWEHGSMLLDPSDLKERYQRIEQWQGGEWVNFYTETVPGAFEKGRPRSSEEEARRSGDDRREASHISFPEPEPIDGGFITPVSATLSGPPSTFGDAVVHQPNDDAIVFPEPEPAPFSPLMPETLERSESLDIPSSSAPFAVTQPPIHSFSTPVPLSVTGPFPLPHPPLDPKQQKEHDKAVKKILKDQQADAKRATSQAEKAFNAQVKEDERETKAQAKLAKVQQTEREKAENVVNDPGTPRHFIITPWDSWPSKSNWQRVPVAGAPHEVDAHCGIFFREKNWEYDEFVDRVADWIVTCCQRNEWGGKDVLAY